MRVRSEAPSPSRRHVRHNSDDLFEDLEHQLGSTLTEYLEVRLTYKHSAFPQDHDRRGSPPGGATNDGILVTHTTVTTTARAVIKRHNSASPWSPRPAPQPNPLFEIIAMHWGPEAANSVMYRVLTTRSAKTTPRRMIVHKQATSPAQRTPTPPKPMLKAQATTSSPPSADKALGPTDS